MRSGRFPWLFAPSLAILAALAPSLKDASVGRGRTAIIVGFVSWLLVALPTVAPIRSRGESASPAALSFCVVTAASLLVATLSMVFLRVFGGGTGLLPMYLTLQYGGALAVFASALALSGRSRPLQTLGAFFHLWREPILKGALLASALLAAPSGAELAFRLATGRTPSTSNDYGFRADLVLAPYVMFAEPRGGPADVNEWGYSGPRLPPRRPNQVRIAFLGGSAAAVGGWTKSIAAYLQRSLSERYPDRRFAVANFGRPSYLSMQELILLERDVLPLGFDAIVVYDGFNDIVVPGAREPLGVGYPYLFSSLKARVEGGDIVNVPLLGRRIAQRSALVQYLVEPAAPSLSRTVQGADLVACAREYERNLYQMAVLARAYGSATLLVVQPFVGTKAPLTRLEQTLLSEDLRVRLSRKYQVIIKASREAAARSTGGHLDATGCLDGAPGEVFSDPVHVHATTAHPVLALCIADELLRQRLLPGLPDPPD